MKPSTRSHSCSLPALVLALLCAACGTSDADHIDEFVKNVTGEVSAERIDQVLARYVDLELQPLEVNVLGDSRGYGPEQSPKLAQDAHARLTFLYGRRLNVLRKHIEIKAPSAWVELQLLGSGGMGNLRFQLDKHAERWLIGRVDVGR
jgi:hypothetical protein